MKLRLLALGLLFAAAGCNGQLSLNQSYVQADRQTKRAVDGFVPAAKAGDPSLSQSIDDTMAAWEKRLEAAEGK